MKNMLLSERGIICLPGDCRSAFCQDQCSTMNLISLCLPQELPAYEIARLIVPD